MEVERRGRRMTGAVRVIVIGSAILALADA
jgi:hypothetical protein